MITKKANQRIIIGYFVLGGFLFVLAAFTKSMTYFIFGVLIICMALLRKHFLMKRLKE